jgi:hypothetical protein
MRGSNKVERAPATEIIQKKRPSVVNRLLESDEEAAVLIRPLESDEEVAAVTPLLESDEEAPTLTLQLESDEEVAKCVSKKRQRPSGKASLLRSVSWPSFFVPVVAAEFTPTVIMSPLKSKFQKINQGELKKCFTPN